MKLVLSGEPLTGDLTGIGHYTFQLAEHLTQLGVSLDFLVHGRKVCGKAFLSAVRDGESIVEADGRPSYSSRVVKLLGYFREKAAAHHILVSLYSRGIPHIERLSLRGFSRDDVFFSTNYLLPPFPGKRVVCIPDLSTFDFPQFHPAARVSFLNTHIERAITEADHIVTISQFVKRQIISRFELASDVVSVTHLAASDGFKPVDDRTWRYPAHGKSRLYREYFLFISTMEPRKNLERLLSAYERYCEMLGIKALPLVLAGHIGWNNRATLDRMEVLQRKGSVTYLGYVSRATVEQLMAGARALIFPSLYEGFGLPVLEAMQSGTSVVTSSNSPMQEIAGSAALYINPFSIASIMNGMVRMTEDIDLCRALEKSGIERAAAFTWSRCASQTLDIFRRVVSVQS